MASVCEQLTKKNEKMRKQWFLLIYFVAPCKQSCCSFRTYVLRCFGSHFQRSCLLQCSSEFFLWRLSCSRICLWRNFVWRSSYFVKVIFRMSAYYRYILIPWTVRLLVGCLAKGGRVKCFSMPGHTFRFNNTARYGNHNQMLLSYEHMQ